MRFIMPQCNADSEAIFNALELSGVSGQKIDDGAAGLPRGRMHRLAIDTSHPLDDSMVKFFTLLLIPLPNQIKNRVDRT
jgi:hypothetical protein